MYCPKCATSLPDDSKFCRACGLDLEIISKLLNDKSQAKIIKSAFDYDESLKKRKKRLQNLGALIMMLSFVVGASIPLIIGLGYENLNSLIMILAGVAGVLLFSGISLAVYADIEPKETEIEELDAKVSLPSAAEKQLLEGNFQAARSVTENTTNLLETEKLKIPRRNGE